MLSQHHRMSRMFDRPPGQLKKLYALDSESGIPKSGARMP
jgi:hypothetical protein